MTVKLYALTCGYLTGSLKHLMEGGEGDVRLPIPSYLIEHPRPGAVRQRHASTMPDRAGGTRRRTPRRHLQVQYAPARVSARLEAMDRDPARIDYLITRTCISITPAAMR